MFAMETITVNDRRVDCFRVGSIYLHPSPIIANTWELGEATFSGYKSLYTGLRKEVAFEAFYVMTDVKIEENPA